MQWNQGQMQPIEWEIVQRFSQLRLEKGWSYRKAADLIGIPYPTFYKIASKQLAPSQKAQEGMLQVLIEFRSWGDGHVR